MQNSSTEKYFYYILFMLMASAFLPLVFNNLPPIIRSHHVWTIIWGISILLGYPKIFFSKPMIYIYTYGLLILLATQTIWRNIDDWNYNMLFKEFYNIVIGASVITYFYQSKDYVSLAKITKWTLVFLFITAIMTIISAAIDPMYARNIIGIDVVDESQKHEILSFKRYGGGGYSTAISFMGLFPIFIYYYKNSLLSLISKKQILIFLIFIFLALISMQIFATIILAVLFSIIAMLGVKKIKKTAIIIVLFISIMIMTPNEFYSNSLNYLSTFFSKDSDINYKLKDLAFFIELGASIEDKNTGTGGRYNRYLQLSETFVKAPIFGCFYNSDNKVNGYFDYYIDLGNGVGQVEGAHLYWMNKLTLTGIIGFLIFCYILYLFIKNSLRYFNDRFKLYFIMSTILMLSYGLIKVIDGREFWYTFFIIIPGLYFLPLLKKNYKQ